MKKTSLVILLIVLVSALFLGMNNVYAADTDFSEIDELINMGNDSTTDNNDNKQDTTSETTSTDLPTTNSTPTVPESSTSVYNNNTTPIPTTPTTTEKSEDKKLSNTGIEDTLPMVALIVVFGLSAVFAYKKIRDYKNV